MCSMIEVSAIDADKTWCNTLSDTNVPCNLIWVQLTPPQKEASAQTHPESWHERMLLLIPKDRRIFYKCLFSDEVILTSYDKGSNLESLIWGVDEHTTDDILVFHKWASNMTF